MSLRISVFVPKFDNDGLIVGSDDIGIFNSFVIFSDQFRVSKSINKVLLAFVTSVICVPVNLYKSQLSIVPKQTLLFSSSF